MTQFCGWGSLHLIYWQGSWLLLRKRLVFWDQYCPVASIFQSLIFTVYEVKSSCFFAFRFFTTSSRYVV